MANRHRIQIEPLASVSPQGVFLAQGNQTARAIPASYIVAFASWRPTSKTTVKDSLDLNAESIPHMSFAMSESKRPATLILRVIQTLTDSKNITSLIPAQFTRRQRPGRSFYVFSPWPKKFHQGRTQLPHHGFPISKIETRAAAIWIGIKMHWAAASRMVSSKLVHTHFLSGCSFDVFSLSKSKNRWFAIVGWHVDG